MKKVNFAERSSIEFVEEGNILAPKFNSDGVIPVVVTETSTGLVLMLGYMNKEALDKTILTNEAYYWSRSREVLWKKGESSGMVHQVDEILIDDDQDSVWLKVTIQGLGASCHVGYRSCCYRSFPIGKPQGDGPLTLDYQEDNKVFDPKEVYGDAPNPTKL